MSLRHSDSATSRLFLKSTLLTRWRWWLKWLWIDAWTETNFCKLRVRRKFSIARSRRRNGWCEFSARLFIQRRARSSSVIPPSIKSPSEIPPLFVKGGGSNFEKWLEGYEPVGFIYPFRNAKADLASNGETSHLVAILQNADVIAAQLARPHRIIGIDSSFECGIGSLLPSFLPPINRLQVARKPLIVRREQKVSVYTKIQIKQSPNADCKSVYTGSIPVVASKFSMTSAIHALPFFDF